MSFLEKFLPRKKINSSPQVDLESQVKAYKARALAEVEELIEKGYDARVYGFPSDNPNSFSVVWEEGRAIAFRVGDEEVTLKATIGRDGEEWRNIHTSRSFVVSQHEVRDAVAKARPSNFSFNGAIQLFPVQAD